MNYQNISFDFHKNSIFKRVACVRNKMCTLINSDYILHIYIILKWMGSEFKSTYQITQIFLFDIFMQILTEGLSYCN